MEWFDTLLYSGAFFYVQSTNFTRIHEFLWKVLYCAPKNFCAKYRLTQRCIFAQNALMLCINAFSCAAIYLRTLFSSFVPLQHFDKCLCTAELRMKFYARRTLLCMEWEWKHRNQREKPVNLWRTHLNNINTAMSWVFIMGLSIYKVMGILTEDINPLEGM